MQVLIAGANGFVGINLALYLLEQGHTVIAAYRGELTPENEAALAPYGERVQFCRGDLLDAETYDGLSAFDPDAIVNCAIMTTPPGDELSYFIPICNINLRSHVNLMEFALQKQVKRFVYVSSSGVYGSYSNPGDVVREDSQLDLFSTYCVTKYASELLTAHMGRLSGMETVSARIAAPYGPFERVTSGRTAMSCVYRLTHMALRGENAVLYGGDVVRDWTYIHDTVRAIAKLLLAPSLRYDIYNVSTARDVSLREIAEAVRQASGGAFSYRFTDDPDEADIAMRPEQQRGALSIERLQADTDYVPEYDIFSGVRAYYQLLKEGKA